MRATRNDHPVKSIDLAGRQRHLEPAMAVLKAVASQFSRGTKRSLPFVARYRGRVVPGSVSSMSLTAAASPISGPLCRAKLESEDGVLWAFVQVDTNAINLIVDGALGGSQSQEEEHELQSVGAELTLAQRALLSRVVRSLADDLAAAIRGVVGVGMRTVGVEVFRQGESAKVEGDALTIACGIEGLGHPGSIGLIVSAEALEASTRGHAPTDAGPEPDPRLAEALDGVLLDVVAELGRMRLGLRRVLTLKPGDVIRLQTAVDDPVAVSIGGIPKLAGDPVVSRGQLSIQIRGRHGE